MTKAAGKQCMIFDLSWNLGLGIWGSECEVMECGNVLLSAL
jgi:hypothetical protein